MNETSKANESEKLELALGYIERYRQPIQLTAENVLVKTDRNFWAYEKLDELVKYSPVIAFEVILEILKQTNDADVLDNVAAGPLEDIVRLHGTNVIGQIEVKAAADPRFKDLLSGLWQVGAPSVWSRVEKILKVK